MLRHSISTCVGIQYSNTIRRRQFSSCPCGTVLLIGLSSHEYTPGALFFGACSLGSLKKEKEKEQKQNKTQH